MKTQVLYKGEPVDRGFVAPNGMRLESCFVYSNHDAEVCVSSTYYSANLRRWTTDPAVFDIDKNVGSDWTVVEYPNYWFMNRRTGLPVRVGDYLPNGTLVAAVVIDNCVRCNNGLTAGRDQIDKLETGAYNDIFPTIPPYRRPCDAGTSTGVMLIDGEWRPYREVAVFANRQYYWIGSHTTVVNLQHDTLLVPLTDTMETHSSGRRLASECIQYQRKWYHKSRCVEIDGVWYPQSACFIIVDDRGNDVKCLHPATVLPEEYRRPERLGANYYIHEDDGVLCNEGEAYHPREDVVEWDGGYYTEDYLEDFTFVCDQCGERRYNDDYDSNGCYCDCESDRGDSRIRDYGNRSANNFTPERDVPVKFGIEFELESHSRSDLLDILDSKFPNRYAVYKEDGSLDSYTGVEVVTRPDCPSVHKRIWGSVFAREDFLRYLTPSSRCGIHIHVSRAPLSALQIGRMLVFLNDVNNRGLVEKIAGRYNETYCEISPKKLVDGKKKNYRRYDILNTSGDNTVEFRMFSSKHAKTSEKFLKNIEFIEALLAFTAPAESGNSRLTAGRFVEYVRVRGKLYPNLRSFLFPRIAK